MGVTELGMIEHKGIGVGSRTVLHMPDGSTQESLLGLTEEQKSRFLKYWEITACGDYFDFSPTRPKSFDENKR